MLSTKSTTLHVANSPPFGITMADIEAFDRRQNTNKVHNAPVRDMTKQDVWDFMLETMPGEDNFITPEVLGVLSGDLN